MGPRGAQEGLKRGPKRLQIALPRLSNIEAQKGRLRVNLKRPFWESLGPKNETPTVRFASFLKSQKVNLRGGGTNSGGFRPAPEGPRGGDIGEGIDIY